MGIKKPFRSSWSTNSSFQIVSTDDVGSNILLYKRNLLGRYHRVLKRKPVILKSKMYVMQKITK